MKTLTKQEFDELVLSVRSSEFPNYDSRLAAEHVVKSTLLSVDPDSYKLQDYEHTSLLSWLSSGYELTSWHYFHRKELAIYFELPELYANYEQLKAMEEQIKYSNERIKTLALQETAAMETRKEAAVKAAAEAEQAASRAETPAS